jgi:hypothetical protein
VQVVEHLAAAPTASVPYLFAGDRAAIKATYRFWDSEAVTPQAIVQAEQQATVKRCAGLPLVLAVQDTTDLTFTHHPATTGLGHLRGSQRGFLVHSVLAVSPDGVPLGLLHQHLWARDPDQRTAKRRYHRQVKDKESQRWLDAEQVALAAVPAATDVLTIADREADIFELLAAERRAGGYLLIRATHPRRIADTPDGEAAYIWSSVQQQTVIGEMTVMARDHRGQPLRPVTLRVRQQTVVVQVPRHHLQRSRYHPVTVHAILAIEEQPPAGKTPIIWRLLTTWPVITANDVLAMIEVYSLRWLIERYHFVLKRGCRVEELQLAQEQRLERAVVTYSIVATRILRLTYRAREEPAAPILPDLESAEWAVLQVRFPHLREQPTVREAIRAIAQLGGFQGRKGDGEPGVLVLWRGFQRLRDYSLGWDLHRSFLSLDQDVGNA